MSNFYATNQLDRAAHLRKDEEWLSSALHEPTSRFVPLWRLQALVPDRTYPSPLSLELAPLEHLTETTHACFLGLHAEAAYFAVDVSALDEAALAGLGTPRELREIGPLLGRVEGALLATARGLLHWHDTHRFCSVCGAPTQQCQGGHLRVCSSATCAREHFPRTDPAVIMLVHDRHERCLLGRQARWPATVYSTLAGFVEPGESLEDAVRRETKEETGISLAQVSYHSSQPWPFPASLMIGFEAAAQSTTLTIDHDELEDARWFTRAQLRQEIAAATIKLPRPDSIARRLILDWLDDVD